jgi:hypothetical protein
MTVGRVGKLALGLVLAATGTYVFVYLWRWEWNRALLAAALFIAAEVALATVTVLERLGRIERRLSEGERQRLARVKESAPPAREPFAWLRPQADHFDVFVPILLGVGVVVSALAWVVERLARVTAGPVLERRLAARLGTLSWPETPLVPGDDSTTGVR